MRISDDLKDTARARIKEFEARNKEDNRAVTVETVTAFTLAQVRRDYPHLNSREHRNLVKEIVRSRVERGMIAHKPVAPIPSRLPDSEIGLVEKVWQARRKQRRQLAKVNGHNRR